MNYLKVLLTGSVCYRNWVFFLSSIQPQTKVQSQNSFVWMRVKIPTYSSSGWGGEGILLGKL